MENEREEIIVTVRDLRASKMCKKGTEVWFKKYNLDFLDFCQNGISSKVIESCNDAMGMKVVEAAYKRREKG